MAYAMTKGAIRWSQTDPFGFIVNFRYVPNWRQAAEKRGAVNFMDTMYREPTFVSFYRLRDRNDPTRAVLYETWNCCKQYFLDVEMKRDYRESYERVLPQLVKKPREMQLDWNLIKCQSRPFENGAGDREKIGFFVYFETKPGTTGNVPKIPGSSPGQYEQ